MSGAAGRGAADEALASQAAEWLVRLSDDDAAQRALVQAEFDAWKRADPRHAEAAAGMERLIGQMQALRHGAGRPARAALGVAFGRGRARARRLRAGVTLLMLLVAPIWLALQVWPLGWLTADVRSAAGQWQTRILDDGTRITVAGNSAVNLHYDAGRRAIELVQGEILVDVAPDAARPFLVDTAHGSIRALGTRFAVERRDEVTVLDMIESRVAVRPALWGAVADGGTTVVREGQRVHIAPDAVGPATAIDARSVADAWAYRQLVVSDEPLSSVLKRLARHRVGRIQYDAAAIAHLRVSAVLPLDDSDRALELLAVSFPELRIRAVTPWWIKVDVAGGAAR